jgi:hypothetical protein
MDTVEAPLVIVVPRNTDIQAHKLADRMLLLAGAVDRPEASRIVTKAMAATQDRAVALQAPYGLYKALQAGENVVAVHVHDSGRIEAYGPFDCDIDAYDYFPRDDTPHNTLIAVFGVPADCS